MTQPEPADVLARLDRRVADAAEAWLVDPRDTGIYARLVAAVAERRAVLDAVPRVALHTAPADEDAGTPDAGTPDAGTPDAEPAEDDDEEPAVPLRPVGADLLGDPRAVLDRLRRG